MTIESSSRPSVSIPDSNGLVREYTEAITGSLIVIGKRREWSVSAALTFKVKINAGLDIRSQGWESCIDDIAENMKKGHLEAKKVLHQLRTCRQNINIITEQGKHNNIRGKLGFAPKKSDLKRRLEDIKKDLDYLVKWWQDLSLKFDHLQKSITGLTPEETLRGESALSELEEINSIYVDYNEKVMEIQDILQSTFPEVVLGTTAHDD